MLISFLTIISCVSNVISQDLEGVWMSISKELNVEESIFLNSTSATLLDFENNIASDIETGTSSEMSVDEEWQWLKIKDVKGKLYIEKSRPDVLILSGKQTKNLIFKKLDFSFSVTMNDLDIVEFISKHHCGLVNDLELSFTNQPYKDDVSKALESPKKKLINKSYGSLGYWYVKIKNDNAFLVFTTGEHELENIYQLTTVGFYGIRLLPLQVNDNMQKLALMKVCF